jgi:hypothetical protein
MRLPCENDQAKLNHISRLACSTNLSKILEGDPPERALLDRGPDLKVRVSSNLLRSLVLHLPQLSAFLREPSKPIEVYLCVNAFFQATRSVNFRPETTHSAKYQITTSNICLSR